MKTAEEILKETFDKHKYRMIDYLLSDQVNPVQEAMEAYADDNRASFPNPLGIQLSFQECKDMIKLLKTVNTEKHQVALPMYGKISEYVSKLEEARIELLRRR